MNRNDSSLLVPIGSITWIMISVVFHLYLVEIQDELWFFSDIIRVAVLALGLIPAVLLVRHNKKTLIGVAIALTLVVSQFYILPWYTFSERFYVTRKLPMYAKHVGDETALAEQRIWLNRNKDLHNYALRGDDDGRIAFIMSRGVVDNWTGLVYDATGLLADTTESHEYWEPVRMDIGNDSSKIFGGDVFLIRRVAPNWFICYFT